MPTRPAVAPSFVCKDVDKTYEYFTQALGFAGMGKWAGPDGRTMHAAAVLPTKLGEAFVMFGPYDMATSGAFGEMGQFGENLKRSPDTLGNGVVTWFNVPDVDKYYAFLKGRGAMIDEAPKDQFWGDRTVSVLIPDGYYLTFASPIKGFQTPPGMGEAEGTGATQATAPLTKKMKLPSGGTRRKAPARAKARVQKAGKRKR